MPNVTIYTTTWCSYCRAAKSFFQSRGIPYEEIDLTEDDAGRQDLRVRSGRTTVPQIWVGETHVGGYDDLRALDARGGLKPLLEQV